MSLQEFHTRSQFMQSVDESDIKRTATGLNELFLSWLRCTCSCLSAFGINSHHREIKLQRFKEWIFFKLDWALKNILLPMAPAANTPIDTSKSSSIKRCLVIAQEIDKLVTDSSTDLSRITAFLEKLNENEESLKQAINAIFDSDNSNLKLQSLLKGPTQSNFESIKNCEHLNRDAKFKQLLKSLIRYLETHIHNESLSFDFKGTLRYQSSNHVDGIEFLFFKDYQLVIERKERIAHDRHLTVTMWKTGQQESENIHWKTRGTIKTNDLLLTSQDSSGYFYHEQQTNDVDRMTTTAVLDFYDMLSDNNLPQVYMARANFSEGLSRVFSYKKIDRYAGIRRLANIKYCAHKNLFFLIHASMYISPSSQLEMTIELAVFSRPQKEAKRKISANELFINNIDGMIYCLEQVSWMYYHKDCLVIHTSSIHKIQSSQHTAYFRTPHVTVIAVSKSLEISLASKWSAEMRLSKEELLETFRVIHTPASPLILVTSSCLAKYRLMLVSKKKLVQLQKNYLAMPKPPRGFQWNGSCLLRPRSTKLLMTSCPYEGHQSSQRVLIVDMKVKL